MIQSMTAFVRQVAPISWGNFTWELRSINHRYLEVNFRLPENLSRFEPQLREKLRATLQRGKIDISLRYAVANKSAAQFTVNKELVQQLIEASASIANISSEPTALLDPMRILQWPGVMQTAEVDANDGESKLLASFAQALAELIQVRQREGQALQLFIQQRLALMPAEIAKVKERLPTILVEQREKILLRLAEAKQALDPARLEQEMVLFAQKIDVTEELDRLATHIVEMERVLQQGGAVGRRLDFLLQELNREANTLGSKSLTVETTKVAVELKVLIEQMREQVQNVE